MSAFEVISWIAVKYISLRFQNENIKIPNKELHVLKLTDPQGNILPYSLWRQEVSKEGMQWKSNPETNLEYVKQTMIVLFVLTILPLNI